MEEQWSPIEDFPGYSVSDHGRVRTDKSGRILRLSLTQFGLLQVGMMRDGTQYHRSVPLLVAKAYIPQPSGRFNTPINLDGDRHNNHVSNLVWRPRWFAAKYNRQFNFPYVNPILAPVVDLETGEVSENSTECAKRYGLLEQEVVFSVLNRTYAWPTYQEFGIWEE